MTLPFFFFFAWRLFFVAARGSWPHRRGRWCTISLCFSLFCWMSMPVPSLSAVSFVFIRFSFFFCPSSLGAAPQLLLPLDLHSNIVHAHHQSPRSCPSALLLDSHGCHSAELRQLWAAPAATQRSTSVPASPFHAAPGWAYHSSATPHRGCWSSATPPTPRVCVAAKGRTGTAGATPNI